MVKTICKNESGLKIEGGFFIGIPYSKGTAEYKNVVEMLKEIAYDNSNEYLVEECDFCEECGTLNRTVEKTKTDEGKKKLCDYCVRKHEG